MAKLASTIIYGNLDVTGNLTINGELLSNIAGNVSDERINAIEQAGVTTAASLLNLQNSFNTLQNSFNGYQGPLELQATSTHIQWRKAGETTWTNLIAISSLIPSIASLQSQINTLQTKIKMIKCKYKNYKEVKLWQNMNVWHVDIFMMKKKKELSLKTYQMIGHVHFAELVKICLEKLKNSKVYR